MNISAPDDVALTLINRSIANDYCQETQWNISIDRLSPI